ncbi:hypothetical protein A8E95_14570 [Burkholderia cenocepacia]|nr:hypothetical protein A8E96_06260 [Burkholderia cenocepacia]ONW33452.1 hypothetical protein A8E95_14570 [Burkholderia cenocepacia]
MPAGGRKEGTGSCGLLTRAAAGAARNIVTAAVCRGLAPHAAAPLLYRWPQIISQISSYYSRYKFN